MKLKIQRHGNSLGIRLPAPVLKDLGMKLGDCFELEQVDAELRLKPVATRPEYDMGALAAQCDSTAPVPASLAAWSALVPVGGERLA